MPGYAVLAGSLKAQFGQHCPRRQTLSTIAVSNRSATQVFGEDANVEFGAIQARLPALQVQVRLFVVRLSASGRAFLRGLPIRQHVDSG
jgi:hypothetical protein